MKKIFLSFVLLFFFCFGFLHVYGASEALYNRVADKVFEKLESRYKEKNDLEKVVIYNMFSERIAEILPTVQDPDVKRVLIILQERFGGSENLNSPTNISQGSIGTGTPTNNSSRYQWLDARGKITTEKNKAACTKDMETGYIWERKTGEPIDDFYKEYGENISRFEEDLGNVNSRFYWYDATLQGPYKGTNNSTSCSYGNQERCTTGSYTKRINSVKLCGKSDWRVPTRNELIDLSKNTSLLNKVLLDGELETTNKNDGYIYEYWAGDSLNLYYRYTVAGISMKTKKQRITTSEQMRRLRLISGTNLVSNSPYLTYGKYYKLDQEGKILPWGSNSYSCVKDLETGLIWEAKQSEGLHGVDNTYQWFESLGSNKIGFTGAGGKGFSGGDTTKCEGLGYCNTEDFITAVKKEGLCGQKNWRLPTDTELLSLKNPFQKGGAYFTFPDLFQNIGNGHSRNRSDYWSSGYKKEPYPSGEIVNFSNRERWSSYDPAKIYNYALLVSESSDYKGKNYSTGVITGPCSSNPPVEVYYYSEELKKCTSTTNYCLTAQATGLDKSTYAAISYYPSKEICIQESSASFYNYSSVLPPVSLSGGGSMSVNNTSNSSASSSSTGVSSGVNSSYSSGTYKMKIDPTRIEPGSSWKFGSCVERKSMYYFSNGKSSCSSGIFDCKDGQYVWGQQFSPGPLYYPNNGTELYEDVKTCEESNGICNKGTIDVLVTGDLILGKQDAAIALKTSTGKYYAYLNGDIIEIKDGRSLCGGKGNWEYRSGKGMVGLHYQDGGCNWFPNGGTERVISFTFRNSDHPTCYAEKKIEFKIRQ